MSCTKDIYYNCDGCGRPLDGPHKNWSHLSKRRYFMDMVGGVTVDVRYQAPCTNQGDLCGDCIWESLAEAMRYVAPDCINIGIGSPTASKTKAQWRDEAHRLEALLKDWKAQKEGK